MAPCITKLDTRTRETAAARMPLGQLQWAKDDPDVCVRDVELSFVDEAVSATGQEA